MPDVSTFPRAAWLRSLREALATMPDADLRYGDPRGVDALRSALADYLGRVRGVVADPARVVVTTGYTQGLGLVCHALAAARRAADRARGPEQPRAAAIARRAGLEPVPSPVDDDGLRVDALARAGADAVVVTPAHQHPTGAVLSGERRTALLAWLRERDAVAIEDDYDAEYRYDRAAVGALQGLEPDRVVYAGSASKTLAPALRLGWLVVPPRLLARVRDEKLLADLGTARIEQQRVRRLPRARRARPPPPPHARPLPRAPRRARRGARRSLPEATVRGIAAGPARDASSCPRRRRAGDRARRPRAAASRSARCATTAATRSAGPPTLMLGYGQTAEPAIRAGVRELAAAVRAAAN